MKSVLKIYFILITGVLLATLAIVTAFKLNTTNPLAPTAPTTQEATEIPPAPDPIANNQVGFKVKINGITLNGPLTVSGHIKLINTQTTTPLYDGDATFQRLVDGMYQTTLTLSSSPSGQLPVVALVKGGKHVQRRFETTITRGTYSDLTEKPLEPGDLPNSIQDGRADTKDIDYIKSKMFSTDSAADLNYDGIVNAGDLSLIIDTLSVKEDEK